MRLAVLLGFLVLIGLLAATNANFLMYPHTFSLGSSQYENLPLGLFLLLLMLVPILIFFFWAGLNELRGMADQAKVLREMEKLRHTLDEKENVRFEALQQYLDVRFLELAQAMSQQAELANQSDLRNSAELYDRLDDFRRDVTLQFSQTDDYLKRHWGKD